MVTDGTNIANTESRVWPLNWHIYIWSGPILKIRVNIILISTVTISRTVTDRQTLLLPTNRKSHKAFSLAYLYLHWQLRKVMVMHISIVNFSQMVTDRANIAIANKWKVACRLSIAEFKSDRGLFQRRSTWQLKRWVALLLKV